MKEFGVGAKRNGSKVAMASLNAHSKGFHPGTICCGLLRQSHWRRVVTGEGFTLFSNDK
jgi:hypothetical protein